MTSTSINLLTKGEPRLTTSSFPLNGIILTNNEFIQVKDVEDVEDVEEKIIYIFRGVNNEIFELVFDNNENYFKILYDKNDLFYTIKCENSYRTPDLKKLLIAFKFRNEVDNQNVFHYEGLKIINISTTFDCYYDQTLKKTIYTKVPKYYTYLLEYNGFCTILSYNEKKYSTKSINISKNEYDYY